MTTYTSPVSVHDLTDFCTLACSLAKEIYFLQNAEGTGLSPFDCWLCLRGIKTMALRVEKQQVLVSTYRSTFLHSKVDGS